MSAAPQSMAAKVSAQIDQLGETARTFCNQRDDARAALLDIISGCEQMQQPALNLTGSFAGFVAEVKRVAQAGLT